VDVMVTKDKWQCLSSPLLFMLLRFWLQTRAKKRNKPKNHRECSTYRMKQLDLLQVTASCGDQTFKTFTEKKFAPMESVVQYVHMIIIEIWRELKSKLY